MYVHLNVIVRSNISYRYRALSRDRPDYYLSFVRYGFVWPFCRFVRKRRDVSKLKIHAVIPIVLGLIQYHSRIGFYSKLSFFSRVRIIMVINLRN